MSIADVRQKVVASALLALLGLGVLTTAPAGAARGVAKGDAFYVPPRPLAKAKPGTIIRSTPIDAPAGARAWKILYHSRAVDGHDIAVSGVVIAPAGRAPRGGRVVVTWAHGTTGLADLCAPSKQSGVASGAPPSSDPPGPYSGVGPPEHGGVLVPMVQTFLDAGYVVAATDYEGLGTPGLHPYGVGESEGRSVLDAARAAHDLKGAAAGSKVLVLGHSQGGHAALFAGELAASYAPELHVLGVAAESLGGVDTELVLPFLASISAAQAGLVMVIEGFHAAYPQFDPAAVLTPDALAKAAIVDEKCEKGIGEAFSSSPPVLAHNPGDIPAMRTILHTNSAGNRPTGAPLLVIQGTADVIAPQAGTDLFVNKACAAGDTVDYRLYIGAGHAVLVLSTNDVAAWFADRVSGMPSTNTCSAP